MSPDTQKLNYCLSGGNVKCDKDIRIILLNTHLPYNPVFILGIYVWEMKYMPKKCFSQILILNLLIISQIGNNINIY